MFGAFKDAVTFAPAVLLHFDQDQRRGVQFCLRGVDRLPRLLRFVSMSVEDSFERSPANLWLGQPCDPG